MNSSNDERAYLFAWSSLKGIGPSILKNIRDRYGSFKFAWQADDVATDAFLLKTYAQRRQIDPLKLWTEHLAKNPNVITLADDDYPKLLTESYALPLLYYRGNKRLLSANKKLAVVGSRKIDHYNASALSQVFQQLTSHSDLVIVSGLALGIDSLAHINALQNNLPTIAVPGSSVSQNEIYPAQHANLAEQIVQANGLLLSPFPQGTEIDIHNFPWRNQIIAGLCQATLVVSAAARSGALITAKLALDTNREVMAIPGNINQLLSCGTNQLIREGAQLITSGQDILAVLGLPVISAEQTDKFQSANQTEKQIINLLKNGPLEINQLLRQLDAADALVRSTISQMELNSWIERKPGNIIELK